MDGNTPVTLWQLIAAVIAALAPQLYQMYSRYRDSKDKETEQETQQEAQKDTQRLTETEKLYREWENVANGYIRQIESLRRYEEENAQLRPLSLKIALVQQENKQIKDDKEDWKDYADRLCKQIEAMGHVPLAFRRTPRDGDTEERLKTISRKMKTVQEEIKIANGEHSATEEKPTVATPVVPIPPSKPEA